MSAGGYAMRNVLVLCEGHTEREFCRTVVGPQLAGSGIALAGTLVGKPQQKRGGIRDWEVYRKELLHLAREHNNRHVAILVDYYRLPTSWPGRTTSPSQPPDQRGTYIEQALVDDMAHELQNRFHPCIQLHEFESLLFVDPDISALSIAYGNGWDDHETVAAQLARVKSNCGDSVEYIDDSPETAPSKRVGNIIRGYDKVAWGVPAVADIGLDALRAGCPWLHRWLCKLESIT